MYVCTSCMCAYLHPQTHTHIHIYRIMNKHIPTYKPKATQTEPAHTTSSTRPAKRRSVYKGSSVPLDCRPGVVSDATDVHLQRHAAKRSRLDNAFGIR